MEEKQTEVIEINEKELGEEFMLPSFVPKSYYTKKRIPRAKRVAKRKAQKIARRKNR